ncbi:nucleoside diphosphate-linked moiety X motif 19-like [Pollicipes pollicipes]|uniref:nucleoside diphosphate-linked moiety X motif 19-like n=1 Tax=Pollicipes pollicipes TaxID=41117 RepID=UPI0018850564|nr:nucleoside diphosphate-linked moiety X motif 19-like [Pollicipes pollicipes]
MAPELSCSIPSTPRKRRRVKARRPTALMELARERRLVPDVWSLHEWSAWLTPVGVTGHRHDAAFFVASVPERPACSADSTESERVEWRRPAEVLADQAAGRTVLMPPQMYELSRLQRFAAWSRLERFSRERAPLGLDRMFPVIAQLSDGNQLGLLLGDDLYPESPDTLGERTVMKLPHTLQEASSGSRRWHRSHMGKASLCNIQLPHGHIAPVPYPAREADMV